MGDAAGDPSGPRQARVDQFAQLPEIFRDLRMGIGRPVIVSIGGVGGMQSVRPPPRSSSCAGLTSPAASPLWAESLHA